MTDPYRAMCAELVKLSVPVDTIPKLNERGLAECLQKLSELAVRARALLDQPVAEGPMDEELDKSFQHWWDEEGSIGPFGMDHEEHAKRISQIAWQNGAYVARLGRDTPQPVAVFELQPGVHLAIATNRGGAGCLGMSKVTGD